MHCISFVARWALCACLLTITNPFEAQTVASAQAQKKKSSKSGKARKAKSVRRCVDFTQTLAPDEDTGGVDLQLTNSCNFEISCSVEWKLECSSTGSTSLTDQSKKETSLDHLESWDLNASASACETDWEIKDLSWQCVATEA